MMSDIGLEEPFDSSDSSCVLMMDETPPASCEAMEEVSQVRSPSPVDPPSPPVQTSSPIPSRASTPEVSLKTFEPPDPSPKEVVYGPKTYAEHMRQYRVHFNEVTEERSRAITRRK